MVIRASTKITKMVRMGDVMLPDCGQNGLAMGSPWLREAGRCVLPLGLVGMAGPVWMTVGILVRTC
jgi:hypothetical protein